ncbi:hypothetical protein [Pseudomonas sp. SWRI154]|uniref:hypothetical protein n=1 Tax=Pseudomonas sp. SWRI154 TaxID=2745501 RepID=UPI001646DCD4|nr:hypothetical protein [Pseudomonas sp. SWRI154]MBC3364967.1 hypothetical protein [Pseudomonas sp. SWRI154]
MAVAAHWSAGTAEREQAPSPQWAVTQLLENIAFREELSSDAVVLHDFALLLAIPLRDGCDVLDVIGRRLQAQALA